MKEKECKAINDYIESIKNGAPPLPKEYLKKHEGLSQEVKQSIESLYNMAQKGRSKAREIRILKYCLILVLIAFSVFIYIRPENKSQSTSKKAEKKAEKPQKRKIAFKIISVKQIARRNSGEMILRIRTNANIDTKKFQKYVKIEDKKKNYNYKISEEEEVSNEVDDFDFTENKKAKNLKIYEKQVKIILPKQQKELFIKIASGITGKNTLALEKNFVKKIEVSPYNFNIDHLYSYSPSLGKPVIHIRFTEQIEWKELQKNLTITPKTSWKLRKYSRGFQITGEFLHERSYKIRIKKELVSKKGWNLGKDIRRNVYIKERTSSLSLAHSGKILSLHGNAIAQVQSVNYKKMRVKLYRLYTNNLVYYSQRYPSVYTASQLGWCILDKYILLDQARNKTVYTSLDFKRFLGKDVQGTYFLKIEGYKNNRYYYTHSDSRFLVISDLGITVKQYQGNFLCWINSLSKGKPIKDATITIWTRRNRKLGEWKTNQNGISQFTCKRKGDNTPYLIQVTKGKDLGILRIGTGIWNTTRFSVSGVNTQKEGYKAFIYSDRGVYRPSETLNLMSIVRTYNRKIPSAFPLELSILRSDGVCMHTIVETPKQGMLELNWKIPEEIRTGKYRVKLAIPGNKKSIASYFFQIEEFVPDRFKMKISFPKDKYKITEKIPVKIEAHHLHGSPASRRKVTLAVQLFPKKFQNKNLSHYSFGDATRSFKPYRVLKTQKELSQQGDLELSVKLPKNIHPGSMLEMLVQSTLHDLGGRTSTRLNKVCISPYPIYLGIRPLSSKKITIEEPVKFEVIAVDENGKIQSLKKAQIRIVQYDWIWSLQQRGRRRVYTYKKVENLEKEKQIDLKQGKNHFVFIPKKYGDYRIFVEDPISGMRTSIPISTWGDTVTRKGAKEYIKLQADSKEYEAGKEAQIHIQAPFDGIALVCLEREKIFQSKIVEIKNRSAKVMFKIKKEYLPNVYCTVTVIRPITFFKGRPIYRAYGIQNLQVNSKHRLKIQLSTAKKIRPNQHLKIDAVVTRQGKAIANAPVTIAIVDEGICQLTNFKTPSPHNFFYAKERLQILSHDQYGQIFPETPAGGLGRIVSRITRPKRRKRFKSLAIWKSNLTTDQEGRISTDVFIPDYIGEVRVMIIATKESSFGSEESFVKVSSPAILQVTAPRFAAWKDKFEVTASLINLTGKENPYKISVAIDEGLQIQGKSSFQGKLKNSQEAFVTFQLNCLNKQSSGKIHFQGHLGKETLEKTIYLPLRSPVGKMHRANCGSLSLGKKETIEIPADWIENTGEISLSISNQPEVKFSSSLSYLIEYPYGCVEQTTSRAMPMLYLENISCMQKEAKKERIPEYIDTAIQRLSLMQTRDGGLAMWPGGRRTYPWGTCYAGHFLSEAKKAGYQVPEALLKGILNYLKRKINQTAYTNYQKEQQAYAAYVLANSQKIRYVDIAHIIENSKKMSSTGKCLLACASAKLGKIDIARMLLESPSTKEYETGDNLHSKARDKAIYLASLIDIYPGSPEVTKIFTELVASAPNGHWGSTQENAYALLAIGKYTRTFASNKQGLTGKVHEKEKILSKFQNKKQIKIHLFPKGKTSITIKTKGKGKCFYTWKSTGIPKKQNIPAICNSMKVTRRILNSEGKEIQEIKQGELLWVELSIKANQDYKNIVVENLLPAGCEIENLRLANTIRIQEIDNPHTITPEYTDIKDDRIIFFLHISNHKHEQKLRYPVRAVSKGKFTFPAITANCMYHPLINARSTASTITIK